MTTCRLGGSAGELPVAWLGRAVEAVYLPSLRRAVQIAVGERASVPDGGMSTEGAQEEVKARCGKSEKAPRAGAA